MNRTLLGTALPLALAVAFFGMAAKPAAAADLTITTNTTLSADHQGAIVIGANGITLDCAGHSITGPGFAGVDIRNVTGVTVKNCHISGFDLGVFVYSAPANRLENNVVSGSSHDGIVLAQSPGNDHNILVGNTSVGNGGWGFAVYDGTTDTTLSGNTARSNSFSGFFVGLDSNRTTLSQNVSSGNSQSGFDIDSDSNTLTSNTATDNVGGLGFFVLQANDNVFNANVARRNQGGFAVFGSDLRNSLRNSFTANVASDNADNGFVVGNGASSARLNDNIADGNGSRGFVFLDVSDVVSQHDQAKGSRFGGFYLQSAERNRLENDVATGNAGEGFVLASSPGNDHNTLVDNTSTGNGSWGFALYDGTTDTTLTGNTARSNSFAGFFVGLDSNRTTLSQNVSLGNSYSGFDVDSDDNTVTDNTATDNSGLGFLIFQANDNVFNGNVARRNQGGFVVGGSDLRSGLRNTFTANVASDNALNGFVVANGASSTRLSNNIATNNASNGFIFDHVTGIVSEHDRASSNGDQGFILVDSTTASSLTHDVSLGNEHGFIAAESSGNLFSQDVANNNQGFGFGLVGGSSGNTVSQSVAHNNPFADAADFNPAGANSWSDNSFGTTFLP